MYTRIALPAASLMALCLFLTACDQQAPNTETTIARAATADSVAASATGEVLPFPAPPMGGSVAPTMQESVHKWRETPSYLPEEAPNILIVMLDDAGFGQPVGQIESLLEMAVIPGEVTAAWQEGASGINKIRQAFAL